MTQSKLSYNEIKAILIEKIESESSFAWEDYDKESLGLGEIEEVHQEGGEGEGDHWESVKYFKDHDVYIKATGHYQSHNGTDFYGWESTLSEVRPVIKTITVYN